MTEESKPMIKTDMVVLVGQLQFAISQRRVLTLKDMEMLADRVEFWASVLRDHQRPSGRGPRIGAD